MNKVLLFAFLLFLNFSLSNCVFMGVATTVATSSMITDERSVGNFVDDKIIIAKIESEFIGKSLKKIFIYVYEGRVLLIGKVKDVKCKSEAEKFAWSVRGVKEVINDITVSDEIKEDTARDLLILTKLKTKLFISKGAHFLNYKVAVYNRVVYLLGIAMKQEEIDSILEIASNVGSVNKVKNYILIRDDERRKN